MPYKNRNKSQHPSNLPFLRKIAGFCGFKTAIFRVLQNFIEKSRKNPQFYRFLRELPAKFRVFTEILRKIPKFSAIFSNFAEIFRNFSHFTGFLRTISATFCGFLRIAENCGNLRAIAGDYGFPASARKTFLLSFDFSIFGHSLQFSIF